MKILELFGEPISRGGQESYVMDIILNIELDNMEIDLLTPYYCDNLQYQKCIKDLGGNIYSLNLKFEPGKSRKNIIRPLKLFFEKNYYDIVHIHSGSISILAYGARMAKRAGVRKVIVHSHSSGFKENIKHFLIKNLASNVLLKYVDVFCACSYNAAKWKFPQKIVDNRTLILKNGIEVEKYQFNLKMREKIRNQYKLGCDEIIIGHVGRFTFEKNQIFLVSLMKEILKYMPSSRMILVGDGECLAEVKRSAEVIEVKNKIIFTGMVDNVNEFMQAFDIFVFPSYYEGLGIVGIEAQTAGLPIVASLGVPEDIKITENVRFVSLGEQSDWIKAILELSKKKVDRYSVYKTAILHGFDVKVTANKVAEIYRT